MNYKTYAEAKMANPDSEIVTTDKRWSGCDDVVGYFEKRMRAHQLSDDAWVVCNPADYCSSIKEFLEAGYIFSVGDFFIGIDGEVISVRGANSSSVPHDDDYKRYILSAAALNGGCKIPAKGEQWSIYNNTLPLRELTDEQVGKLVKHSGCVEHMNPNSGEWVATIIPMWNRARVYRITPKSERELFIDKSMEVFKENQHNKAEFMLGKIYDAGARYKDLTQHFGENI